MIPLKKRIRSVINPRDLENIDYYPNKCEASESGNVAYIVAASPSSNTDTGGTRGRKLHTRKIQENQRKR